MEKQQVIQELHRLRDLWNEINPLVDKRSHYDNNKKNAENRRNEELKKEYQYNSNIKSVKRLPTNNADLVEEEIMIRHRKDCIKAAKKKMAIASTVITLVTIACIALFIALPHISNIVNNNSAPYNFDSSSQNTSNSVANVFVSAVLFMLIQSGLLCFVGTAAFSVLKEESYNPIVLNIYLYYSTREYIVSIKYFKLV